LSTRRKLRKATTQFGVSQPPIKRLIHIQRKFKRDPELELKRKPLNKTAKRSTKSQNGEENLTRHQKNRLKKRRQRPTKKEKKNSSRKKKNPPLRTKGLKSLKRKRTGLQEVKSQTFEIINCLSHKLRNNHYLL
jgi:hypothetical protein